jgi:sugar lactone lactonase YvrE
MRLISILLFTFFALTSYSQFYSEAESVEWDPINEQWLVSNGFNIIADDGLGNKTVFSDDGTSYGLEVMGDVVYGLTGSALKAIDLNTKETLFKLTITGAGFLNGLTNDGESTLYATDFSNREVYAIDVSNINQPTYEKFISNTFETPNGILYDGANNRLLYVTWQSNAQIKAIDLTTKAITTVVSTNLNNIDGIDDDAEGNFYVSSWSPAFITKYNHDFTFSEVISTPTLNKPADIGFNKDDMVLGIPMGSNVIFISLGQVGVAEIDNGRITFGVSSNPIQNNSQLSIDLIRSEKITVVIYDMSGQILETVIDSELSTGSHLFDIDTSKLSSGMYVAVLFEKNGKMISQKLMKE